MSNHTDKKIAKKTATSWNFTSNKLAATVLVGLIIAAGSFFGGIAYHKGQQPSSSSRPSDTPGIRGFESQAPKDAGLMGTVIGEVSALSDTSISVEDAMSGSITTLEITSSTEVFIDEKPGSMSDIKIGSTVVLKTNPSNAKQVNQILMSTGTKGGGRATP